MVVMQMAHYYCFQIFGLDTPRLELVPDAVFRGYADAGCEVESRHPKREEAR